MHHGLTELVVSVVYGFADISVRLTSQANDIDLTDSGYPWHEAGFVLLGPIHPG